MQPVLLKLLISGHSSHLTTDVKLAERGTGTNGCGTSFSLLMSHSSAVRVELIPVMLFLSSFLSPKDFRCATAHEGAS